MNICEFALCLDPVHFLTCPHDGSRVGRPFLAVRASTLWGLGAFARVWSRQKTRCHVDEALLKELVSLSEEKLRAVAYQARSAEVLWT